MGVFVRKEMVIPPGGRCWAGHLISGKLSDDTVQKLETNDSVLLNSTSIQIMIQSLRELTLEFGHQRLNFDDKSSMNNEDYEVLTALSRTEFQDIISTVTVTSINLSKSRNKRTCVAILLVK